MQSAVTQETGAEHLRCPPRGTGSCRATAVFLSHPLWSHRCVLPRTGMEQMLAGRCRCLEGGKTAVDSGSGCHSAHAGESKAQCLSVPTSETRSCLLALLAAQSPDTGLPTLSTTTTYASLQHLLFFQPQVLLSYFSYTTFCLQSCRSVCAPLFFAKSRDTAARAE